MVHNITVHKPGSVIFIMYFDTSS